MDVGYEKVAIMLAVGLETSVINAQYKGILHIHVYNKAS